MAEEQQEQTNDRAERWYGTSPAGPTGLNQQSTALQNDPGATNFDGSPTTLTDRAQRWYGGGQIGSTENGYNTGFYQRFMDQQNAAVEGGYLNDFFAQKDATGIVTYDHTDSKGSRRFGDVYENGELVGNVYDVYDEGAADLMMADLTMSAQEKKNSFENGTLHQDVQARKAQTESEVAKGQGAAEYAEAVDEQADEWQQGAGDDWATFAGGFTAGAGMGATGFAVGGPLGFVTTIGGGLIGGIGAWLNRDEIVQQAAAARVQQQMAHEQGGYAAGFTTGLKEWVGGVGGKLISPMSNLTHGINDQITEGMDGDNIFTALGTSDRDEAWYATNAEGELIRSNLLTGIDIAAGFTDAALQFATPVGRSLFATTMSASIMGEVGQISSMGGATFDPRRGDFDNIFTDDEGNFDPKSAMAGLGKIGIDAVQLGMGRGLAARARSARASYTSTTGAAGSGALGSSNPLNYNLIDKLARLDKVAGGQIVEQGGFRYAVDAAGRAVGRRRASVGLLAPSEAIQAISAGALARRAKARGEALAADDFYQAANKMANGERRFQSALVNAFGEGTEEGVQAVLEPMSHHGEIDAEEIFENFLRGAAMGAGMTTGALRGRGVGAQDRMYAQAVVVRKALTGDELTREEWDGMTDVEKRDALQSPEWLTEATRAAAQHLEESQGRRWAASVQGVEKYIAAVERQAQSELGNLTKRTDGAYVITQNADADVPNQSVSSSLRTMSDNLLEHLRGLEMQSEAITDEATKASLDAAIAQGEVMQQILTQTARRFTTAVGPEQQQAELEFINDILARWFAMEQVPGEAEVDADTLRARARAVSLVFVRDPQDSTGSYQILMPRADFELTRTQSDSVLQISHAILEPLGGDYDGDKIRQQAQRVIDDKSFDDLRTGINFLSVKDGGKVNIPARPYEVWEIDELGAAFTGGGAMYKVATKAISVMEQQLRARYEGAVIPKADLDPILQAFRTDLQTGTGSARQSLLDTLATDWGTEMGQFARGNNLSNEWLWIDQTVQQTLQAFQRTAASRSLDGIQINTDEVAATKGTSSYREVRQQTAATEGMQLSIVGEGTTLLRLFQKLHYSSWNSSDITGNAEGNIMELAELTRFYEALGQGMVETEIAQLQAKDQITGRVSAQLRRIGAELAAESDTRTGLNMMQIAATQMPDVQDDGTVGSTKLTFAQVLLRRSIAQDRAKYAGQETPEVARRWSSLEALLSPDRAEEALVEVLGQFPLYELVGEAAEVIGADLTLEQAVRVVRAQGPQQRQDTKRKLQMEPEYLGTDETQATQTDMPYTLEATERGQVTAFHAMVDTLMGAANKQLSLGDDGLAIGRMGEGKDGLSGRTHAAIVKGFSQIQVALADMRKLTKLPLKDANELRVAMDQFPDLASVFDLIPDAAANAVFEMRDGELYVADWAYEMLLMEPERAAMHYWRHSMIAQLNAQGAKLQHEEEVLPARAYDKLNHRIHRLMYRLEKEDPTGIRIQRFMAKLDEATSLHEFMRFVNTDLRQNEAPYVAWVNDVSEFDPDKTGGGLTNVLEGAEQREAILSFRDKTQRLVKTVQEELEIERADADTMAELWQGLQPGADKVLVGRVNDLQRHIDFALTQRTAAGAGIMRKTVAGAVQGVNGQMHTKGVAAENTVALGAAQAKGDGSGYATGYEQAEAALTTEDVEDVAANMQRLARDDIETMDETGRPIRWEKMTAENVIKLWREDPTSHSAIRAILFPQVWERTEDDRLTQQFLVGKSLTSLLKRDPYAHMFDGKPDSKMAYASQIDALSKKYGGSFPITRLASDLAIARTTAKKGKMSASDIEDETHQAFMDIVEVLRTVGTLSAQGVASDTNDSGTAVSVLSTFREELRRRGRDSRLAKAMGMKNQDGGLTDQTIEEYLDLYEMDVLEQMKQHDAATEDGATAIARLTSGLKREKRRIEFLKASDPAAALRSTFEIDWSSTTRSVEQRREIVEYIRAHDSIRQKAGFAMEDIDRMLHAAQNNKIETNTGLPRIWQDEKANQDSWDVLSKAIIVSYLDDMANHSAANVEAPFFPDEDQEQQMRYWDPTYTYLVEEILNADSPVVQAARELATHAQQGSDRAVTDIPDLIERTILNPKKLGPWSPEIVRMSVEANNARIDSAASGDAISMSGLAVARQRAISAATRRTYEPPAPNTVSLATITGDSLFDLREADEPRTTLAMPDGQVLPDQELPLEMMNGRFASDVRLSWVDGNGARQTLEDLWQNHRPTLGRYFTGDQSVLESGYRAITVRELRELVKKVVPDTVARKDITVEVDYFHPESQPALPEYYNNVYYEGLSYEVDADKFDSLNSSLWFAAGAVSQTAQLMALKSIKSGKPALRTGDAVLSNDPVHGRAVLESGWEQDFGGMLRRKTQSLLGRDLGTGVLHPTFFNALYKRIKLMHYVRGFEVSEDGERNAVLLTAEEMIAEQKKAPEERRNIVDMELWKPSPRILRTLMGETGPQGTRRVPQESPIVDPRSIPQYKGITPEMLKRLPGALEVDPENGRFTEGNLFRTQAAASRYQTMHKMRPALDRRTRNTYEKGLQVAAARRQKIYDARADEARRSSDGFRAGMDKREAEQAISLVQTASTKLGLQAAGLPIPTSRTEADERISRHLLWELNEVLNLSEGQAIWLVKESGRKEDTVNGGVLTPATFDDSYSEYVAPAAHNQLAPEDIAIVDLANLEENIPEESRLSTSTRRIQKLMDARATIVLPDSTTGGDLRADLAKIMLRSGYERVAGSNHVFRPRNLDSVFATQQARQSTLTETHSISGRSHIANLLVANKYIAENAGIVVNPDKSRSLAVAVDLVPKSFLGAYNAPTSPRNIEQVRAHVRGMLDDETGTEAHVRTLLQGGTNKAVKDSDVAEFMAALRRSYENWDETSVLPRNGAEFKIGDIIPLYDSSTGGMLFYRHGHRAPGGWRIREMIQTPKEGDTRPAKYAVFSNERNPDHTVHTGRVVESSANSKYGLTLRMHIPLQTYGDKLQLEGNGMKYVLTTNSGQIKLPDHPMFQNFRIDLAAAWDDARSKESTGGLVNNFRNAFGYFGVDFTPDLVKFFWGETYSDLTPEQQDKRRTDLNNVLQTLRRTLPKFDAGRVQDLMRSTSPANELSEIRGLLGSAGAESDADGTWIDRMLAVEPAPEASIAKATVMYLMSHDAQVEHVLKASGFSGEARESATAGETIMMPRLFTNFFDDAPIGSELRTHLFDKLNQRLNNPPSSSRGRQTGYALLQDFSFAVRNKDAKDDLRGWIQFAEAHSSGDNPVLNKMAFERANKQKVSQHAAAIAYQAVGASEAVGAELPKTERFVTGEGVERFDQDGSITRLFRDIPEKDRSYVPWQSHSPAEQYYMGLARDAVGTFRKPLDMSEWEEAEVAAYQRIAVDIMHAYDLSAQQVELVDFWVRQVLGQPLGEGDQGRITGSNAVDAATEIRDNARDGYLPVQSAEVPQIHYFDLALIYRQAQKKGGFKLRQGLNDSTRLGSNDWDGWTKVALAVGDTNHELFDPLYLLATDGFMHTYIDAGDSLVGLPVSRDVLKSQKMMDAETNRMVLSINPHQRTIMEETPQAGADTHALAELMGGERVGGRYLAKSAPTSAREKRRKARARWRKENGIPMAAPTTMKNYREYGAQFLEESTTNNAFLRIITNLRVANALLNPMLFISAGALETPIRGALEDMTNLLTGDSTGALSRAGAAVGITPRYSRDQLQGLRNLTHALGTRADFKGMIYGELMFQQRPLSNAGRIEKATSTAAKIGSRVQDPTYGMRGDVLARRYVETVLREMASLPDVYTFSPDYLVAQMATNPQWVKQNYPDAHQVALNTIAQQRSLRATPLSLALRGIYEPLSENPNLAISAPSTLFLKLPLMFSTYATNVASQMFGLQGFNAALATLLHGRDGKGAALLGRMQAAMAGRPYNEETDGTIDMSAALDGIDLSKAFIQSGISVTSLFALGMAAGGLGLSGEDEEDKRRRRAAEYQNAGYVYDPRKIQNDFRNADAVFLDWLPFGLDSFFRVTTESDPSGARAMGDLHWILRQFVSPVIGMERFFETGDSRQLIWGFQDALGAFPLINENTWVDAVETFAELDAMSKEAEALGTPQDLSNAYGFLVSGVAAFESMLLENSFVNSIYTSLDKYDRDPWKLPMLDSDGNLQVQQVTGAPRETDALDSYVDPQTGETRQAYPQRDWLDAQIHSLTENRGSLALMMSLLTGDALSSDYIRQNMVIKTREIEKLALTEDEATAALLSQFKDAAAGQSMEFTYWDSDAYQERVNIIGADAVIRGLYKGSVNFDDDALAGVFIPFEMREEIQANWMNDLVQEGVDMGLSKTQAEARMRRVFYGDQQNPESVGLSDILWSDQISYSPKIEYNQLNTTYVMGPDGRPWATGVTRDTLFSALGLPPIARFYSGEVGNLGVDSRLNSTDEVNNLNTGLRGLERVDDSWNTPTEAEIGESIEKALKDIADKDFGSSYSKDGGSGGGGGGRGGGGGYTRLYAPPGNRAPYANSMPYLNANSPYVRRASIRRERFTSQRGRLKQWQ